MPRPAHVEIPDPDVLMRRLRVFAMVDAIVSPEFRSFELHPRWGRGEVVGAFKNGSGDFFFAWRCGRGTVVRGFDHECSMSPFRRDPPTIWPGLLDGFPAALEYALREPAFGDTELTFCLWHTDGGWEEADFARPRGDDPDGSAHVLACLQQAFPRWARDYYGTELPPGPLAALWRGVPLTPGLVTALNPDVDLTAVRAEAQELDWPLAAPPAARTAVAAATGGKQPKVKLKAKATAKPTATAKPKATAKATATAKAKTRTKARTTVKAKAKAKARPKGRRR